SPVARSMARAAAWSGPVLMASLCMAWVRSWLGLWLGLSWGPDAGNPARVARCGVSVSWVAYLAQAQIAAPHWHRLISPRARSRPRVGDSAALLREWRLKAGMEPMLYCNNADCQVAPASNAAAPEQASASDRTLPWRRCTMSVRTPDTSARTEFFTVFSN